MSAQPQSIAYFERIYLGTLVLGLAQSWLSWDKATQLASTGFVVTTLTFTFAAFVVLIFLVSRGRSRIAYWILLALFVVGLPVFVKHVLDREFIGNGWIAALQTIGQIIALALLWTPTARFWLKARHDPAQNSESYSNSTMT